MKNCILILIALVLFVSCNSTTSEKQIKHESKRENNSHNSYSIPEKSVVGTWELIALEKKNRVYYPNGTSKLSAKPKVLKYVHSKLDSMVYKFNSDHSIEFNGAEIGEWSIEPDGVYLKQTNYNILSPIILNMKYDYIFNIKTSRQLSTMLYDEKGKLRVEIKYDLISK